MKIEVHLYTQSLPVVIRRARNAYQKGDLYCVMTTTAIYKFPLQHVFRIKESES